MLNFLNLAAFGNNVAVSPSDSVIIGLLRHILTKTDLVDGLHIIQCQ